MKQHMDRQGGIDGVMRRFDTHHLCRYANVCLGALNTDCRYTGGDLQCEKSDEYPKGYVHQKASAGVAM